MTDAPDPEAGELGVTRTAENSDARDDDFDDHEYEDALEPTHLIRRSDVVLRAGILMLGAGTSGLRVREVMEAVARAIGLDEISAQVTSTDIALSVRRRDTFRTQVAEIPAPGVNAHRIALLQSFAATLPSRLTAAEVGERLDQIEGTPRLYPDWLLAVMVGLACAGVTVLGNGGWREVAMVLPAGMLGFGLRQLLARLHINTLASIVTVAAVSVGAFLLLSRALDAALGGPSGRVAAGVVCAAIFLIPGFPLITAGLDLARLDLMTGIPRMVYAFMVLLAITIGVWLVISVSGVSPEIVDPVEGHPVLHWLAFVLASFTAVLGWAMMFNTPLWTAVTAGAVAALGNVPRLMMLDAGIKPHIATFVGCFVMGLLCGLAGVAFKMAKIIMTVPTVLVSIPGASALRTLIWFDQANVIKAMENGVTTTMVAISMVAGLAAARMLTDPEWAFTRVDRAPARLGRLLGLAR